MEARQEPCRDGRTYRMLVNHRTHQAMELPAGSRPSCLTVSVARLDLRWNGAGRMVRAACARDLFHPTAAGQALLAENGYPTDRPRPQLFTRMLNGFSQPGGINPFDPPNTVDDHQLWGLDGGSLGTGNPVPGCPPDNRG